MPPESRFATTHWTVVLQAAQQSVPESRDALAALCGTYWYPLYAYLRHRGHQMHEAEDLVQGFFARLLDGNLIGVANPDRGRFRSFLLAALNNFAANEWQKAQAQKRGGGVVLVSFDASLGECRYSREPAIKLTPEKLYERQWAVTLLEQVISALRDEFVRAGKEEQFDCLKGFLAGPNPEGGYAEAAVELGMSKSAAMTAVSRLRQRYRELLRSEIARTVTQPEEVDDEIGRLFEALGS